MIFINGIPSFRDPESCKVTLGDRVQKIEVIGGVVIQDLGRVEDDDVFSITCMFTTENFNQLMSLWTLRTPVTFKDTGGTDWSNLYLVMKEFERDKNFPQYVMATFELWRVKEWQTNT